MAKKKADVVDAAPGAETPTEATRPLPGLTDPGYTDYIISLMVPGELDGDGNPTIAGLRRVAEKELGPILEEAATVVQAPNAQNNFHAVVEHGIRIDFSLGRFPRGGRDYDERGFSDVADVYPGNTDPEFARFATASASTKAAARCFRKALKLNRVTADEKTTVPVADAGLTGGITDNQVHAINKTCRDLDIDVMKFVNSGKVTYGHISQVPYDKALDMMGFINRYIQNPAKIPDGIRGYDPDWQGASR